MLPPRQILYGSKSVIIITSIKGRPLLRGHFSWTGIQNAHIIFVIIITSIKGTLPLSGLVSWSGIQNSDIIFVIITSIKGTPLLRGWDPRWDWWDPAWNYRIPPRCDPRQDPDQDYGLPQAGSHLELVESQPGLWDPTRAPT